MRKISFRLLSCLLAGIAVLLSVAGCYKVAPATTKTYTYTLYTPITEMKSTYLAAINGDPAKKIDSAGKIFRKDPWIFLNDVDEGIHIIDNSDPRHPQQVAFLSIPGNQEISVRGNTLYADMYGDLLAIDITDPLHAKVKGYAYNVFKQRAFVHGYSTDSLHVIVGWTEKDTTVTVTVSNYGCRNCMYDMLTVPGQMYAAAAAASSDKSTGIGGSTAGMTLIGDYIYAIGEPHSLTTLALGPNGVPSTLATQFVGFDLETIFPFQDKLFLGSKQGVYMYQISNPATPLAIGQFSHGRACDPVVSDGDYAYVTLRTGTSCGGADNELDVVDVRDPAHAVLVKSYPMVTPQGLGKDGNLLFVCDAGQGVRLLDASNPQALQTIGKIGAGSPTDVIAAGNRLLVVDKTGFSQYDYSNSRQIDLLSYYSTQKGSN